MPALNKNEKIKCEKCGDDYRTSDAARHQRRCQHKDEHKCPNCNFMCKKKQEMDYHVAKKHAERSSKQSTVCPSCEQEFPSYYSLQQHRRKEHGAKQRKHSDTVADLNKIVEEEGEDGEKLKEELSACHFFQVDTEMENGKHKVFNFKMSKLDTEITNEKLEETSTSSSLPLKSTLHWGLVFEKLRLVKIDISTPMKTILYLKNHICSVLKQT